MEIRTTGGLLSDEAGIFKDRNGYWHYRYKGRNGAFITVSGGLSKEEAIEGYETMAKRCEQMYGA